MGPDTLQHGVRCLMLKSMTCLLTAGLLIASYGGPANFATKLHKSPESWNVTGELDFLNDWCVLLL